MTDETTPAPKRRGRPPKVETPEEKRPWGPDAKDFINLKGKMYLPARRRVQWFRGPDIEPHPDWTIDTDVSEFERGKYIRKDRVEGGFAVVRANIFNPEGRLIATGIKTEYSENFSDFLEKAETGAIARALAIAGYGTESALDLDEGVDEGRIADAPVDAATTPSASGLPGVTISAAAAAGGAVARGGKAIDATGTQIRAIASLAKKLSLDPAALLDIVEQVVGGPVPDVSALTPEDASKQLVAFFGLMPAEQLGKVITSLQNASDARTSGAPGGLQKFWEKDDDEV